MIYTWYTRQRGQTVIEAIVVVGVVILLVTGLIAGTVVSLKNVRNARTRSQAVKYAQEAVEVIRSERNSNWTDFFSIYNGYYCLGSDAVFVATISGCPNNIVTSDSVFSRTVSFVPSGDIMRVAVSVSYPDAIKSIDITTYLTKWK